jgi:hypothetical protein
MKAVVGIARPIPKSIRGSDKVAVIVVLVTDQDLSLVVSAHYGDGTDEILAVVS